MTMSVRDAFVNQPCVKKPRLYKRGFSDEIAATINETVIDRTAMTAVGAGP